MRILNEDNKEMISPDLSVGYLKEEAVFVRHHPATNYVEEVWHYETVAEYPNGGKDVKKVVDIPGSEAQGAWDEYEAILRYVLYSKEELAILQKRTSIWDELDSAYREGVNHAYEQ